MARDTRAFAIAGIVSAALVLTALPAAVFAASPLTPAEQQAASAFANTLVSKVQEAIAGLPPEQQEAAAQAALEQAIIESGLSPSVVAAALEQAKTKLTELNLMTSGITNAMATVNKTVLAAVESGATGSFQSGGPTGGFSFSSGTSGGGGGGGVTHPPVGS